MTRFIPLAPFFFTFALPLPLAFTLALHGCAPSTCASDSDCAIDSVCLIDADGPRCTTIELAARVVPEGAPAEPGLDGDDVDHEPNDSGIVLREATMSFAPEARTATIVMRPISVVVTRSPSPSTSTSTGSDPDPDP